MACTCARALSLFLPLVLERTLSLSSSLHLCISSVPVTHYLPRSVCALTHTRSPCPLPPSLPFCPPVSQPFSSFPSSVACGRSLSLTHTLSHILCHSHTLSLSLFCARTRLLSFPLSLALSLSLSPYTYSHSHTHSLVHQIISWMEASDEIPLEVLVEAFRQQADYEVYMLVYVHIDI